MVCFTLRKEWKLKRTKRVLYLYSFSYSGFHSFLFVGVSCLAMAGILLLTTQFQVANLYTGGRGKVLNLFNGAMDSSSSSALIILAIYNAFGYKTTWLLYTLVTALVFVRTLTLLPKMQIPYLRLHKFAKSLMIMMKSNSSSKF